MTPMSKYFNIYLMLFIYNSDNGVLVWIVAI